MRIIFMGTPQFAVPTLEKLIQKKHHITLCATRPAKATGRSLQIRQTAVATAAHSHNIETITPKSFSQSSFSQSHFSQNHVYQQLYDAKADVIIVVAYGVILNKAVLELPPYGCLNAHASLLPRWRGAAPIERAVMANDARTGITIMKMDEDCDTGDIAISESIAIEKDTTAKILHDKLAVMAADNIVLALELLEKNELKFIPQNHTKACYAKKITAADCSIDFNKTATQIEAQIRALAPKPAAYFQVNLKGKNENIRVLKAEAIEHKQNLQNDGLAKIEHKTMWLKCKIGALKPLIVQRAGRKPMAIKDFLNGLQNTDIKVIS